MSSCCQTTEQKKMETDHLIQTKTDSKLFISNQMVRPNICILFLILYIYPYVQNLSHKQIIKHNVQQAGMNQNKILHLLNEVWILQHIENKFFPKILPQNYALSGRKFCKHCLTTWLFFLSHLILIIWSDKINSTEINETKFNLRENGLARIHKRRLNLIMIFQLKMIFHKRIFEMLKFSLVSWLFSSYFKIKIKYPHCRWTIIPGFIPGLNLVIFREYGPLCRNPA